MEQFLSTTQLAKKHGMPSKKLFESFLEEGYVGRSNDDWILTAKGKAAGGQYKQSPKYGQYVVWPVDLVLPDLAGIVVHDGKFVSATALGEHFKMPARQMNTVLSELGWIKKHVKGWQITEHGKRLGGQQKENFKSGIPYVVWPDSLIANENLVKTVNEVTGEGIKALPDEAPSANKFSEFRSSIPKQRTADGHYVRSRAEMLIDNWLYMAEIVHAYERRLPIEEEVYCDFYLPVGKVYIEFWGMESNEKYAERKKEKKETYAKYGLNLVELNDDDIVNLDDVLPRLLLKHGITTY